MSAQAQMEEIRRLSGEHPPAPPPPEAEPPVSKRVAVAMLLAALVGVGLLHAVLAKRFAARTGARAERAAMIVARAAADVATAYGGEGDSLRSAMAAWQKEHPNVSAIRIVNIDRRPFAEVAVSREGGEILIAAPVEKDGSVIGFAQVRMRPEIVAVEAPSFWFALAFALAPFVVVLALSFVMRKHAPLVLIACGLLFVTLFAYRQWAMGSLEAGARAAEQRFAERVAHEAGIVARIAPGVERKAATWDADTRRVPLRIDPARAVEGEKSTVANASYAIGVLSLALLLFVGHRSS